LSVSPFNRSSSHLFLYFFPYLISFSIFFFYLCAMKQAMIFAAGLGTRLRPLTDTMPKALVPVGGKPLLQRVIERLKDFDVERIVVNIHHFGEQIIEFLEANDNFGIDIRISDERDALLDTGGGIKKARQLFDPSAPILIHNVDILSNADFEALYSPTALYETPSTTSPEAVLLVSPRETSRYLLFDDNRRLLGWQNIKTGELRGPIRDHEDTENIHAMAFSGIHVFNPSLFPLMDAWPDKFSIIDFYLSVCSEHFILGQPADLRLMDVGKLDTLADADSFVQSL